MITTLGVLLLIITIVAFSARVYNKYAEDYNEATDQTFDRKPIFPVKKFTPWAFLIATVLVFLFGVANPVGHNSYGYRQVVENPLSGNTWVQFEQGWYFKGFFSTEYQYPNVITTMFTSKQPEEKITSLDSAFGIRFNDATRAVAEATVRWRLPQDEEHMLDIHREYHGPGRLASATLHKYTRECLRYAAQLMESETHYSGGMSKLSEDFQDQLENGQFVIESKAEYVKDTLSGENRKLTTTFVRRDANGIPIRNKSDVQQFNITVAYASVDEVDYEEQVDIKLAEKIEASTKESISKQKLITAQQEALTAKAEGEKLIAETRATEEASKIEAVIRAQKEAEVAKENLRRDELKAKAELAIKKAQAEGDRLKVAAGLTPKERADIDKETAIGIAEWLSKRPVPQIVIEGGTGSQSTLSNAYSMEQMLLLLDKLNRKRD